MTEKDPFQSAREKPRFTKVELRGPNVTNSIDRPPRPGALRVQRAAIRRHLSDRPRRDEDLESS
jgi:hypothetical protein